MRVDWRHERVGGPSACSYKHNSWLPLNYSKALQTEGFRVRSSAKDSVYQLPGNDIVTQRV